MHSRTGALLRVRRELHLRAAESAPQPAAPDHRPRAFVIAVAMPPLVLFAPPAPLPPSHRPQCRRRRLPALCSRPPPHAPPPSSPLPPPPAPFRVAQRAPPGLTVLYSRSLDPITADNLPNLLRYVRAQPQPRAVLLAVAPHAALPPAPARQLSALGVRLVRRSVLSAVPSASPTPPEPPAPVPPSTAPRYTFSLHAPYALAGSQPHAVRFLTRRILNRYGPFHTLAGVTGSGKSYMMASVIAAVQMPTLVLAPNKTLAAQLYNQFKAFFPQNRVEFFVSNFKHYQPEAYLPASDKYIAKSSSIDSELDRLRHAATKSLFERNDTIVVATVSSIYGLGLPSEYLKAAFTARVGDQLTVAQLAKALTSLNYVHHHLNVETTRGHFRSSHNLVDVSPPWEQPGVLYRYCFEEHRLVSLHRVHLPSNSVHDLGEQLVLYPANHFVTPKHLLQDAIQRIQHETSQTVARFLAKGENLQAARLQHRVHADVQMLTKVGHCHGIENYSLHLSGRDPLTPPETLLDYMPKHGKWLLFIDESHVTVPQLGAMYTANAARKKKLVQYGFRLPSAMENRPLSMCEFWAKTHQTVFVSATPGPFELEKSHADGIVQAVIRPTGVVDPTVEVVKTTGQIEHLTARLATVASTGGKAIVTTVTKRFAEDVAECLANKPPVSGVLERPLRVTFLHSGIDSVGRMHVLEAMRSNDNSGNQRIDGSYMKMAPLDVVVGVNLLREGIDLPAVQLVAILDADSEGFLRGETALIQMIGRAARNVKGHVIMYGDTVTTAMRRAIDETARRRRLQLAYNSLYAVNPTPVGEPDSESSQKREPLLQRIRDMKRKQGLSASEYRLGPPCSIPINSSNSLFISKQSVYTQADVESLKDRMLSAARAEDFETAALLRDQLHLLRALDR